MPAFTEKLKVAGQDMEVYAAVPRGNGPFPAVVVAQHGAGVDRFIKTICDRLAEQGYAAVAPDLFHRVTPEMVADGSRKSQHLTDQGIVADMSAAVDWLRGHRAIDGNRIGITGFCMGGRVTWLVAASRPDAVKAAIPFYGGNIFNKQRDAAKSPFELSANINCPVQFHFGELDQNPSQEDMRKLDAELTRLGKPHQFYTYPGANHGFMDFTGQRHHRPAEEAAWPRALEFFDRHLKGVAVANR